MLGCAVPGFCCACSGKLYSAAGCSVWQTVCKSSAAGQLVYAVWELCASQTLPVPSYACQASQGQGLRGFWGAQEQLCCLMHKAHAPSVGMLPGLQACPDGSRDIRQRPQVAGRRQSRRLRRLSGMSLTWKWNTTGMCSLTPAPRAAASSGLCWKCGPCRQVQLAFCCWKVLLATILGSVIAPDGFCAASRQLQHCRTGSAGTFAVAGQSWPACQSFKAMQHTPLGKPLRIDIDVQLHIRLKDSPVGGPPAR